MGQSLNDFVAYGLILIEHHRVLFPPRKRLASKKLDYLLRYIFKIISTLPKSYIENMIFHENKTFILRKIYLRCFDELKEMRVYHRFCFEREDIIEDVKEALRKGTTQL